MRSRLTAIATALGIMSGVVSCVTINEELGENFIPTGQIWQVYPCEAQELTEITMERSDSLSGYNTNRFVFGSVMDDEFLSEKSTSFTLVPLADTLDFGEDCQVLQFHFSAVQDTVSVLHDNQKRMLQNVFVHPLRKALDSTVLYAGEFTKRERLEEFVDLGRTITEGIPVYNGGDSLSFDFSKEYAKELIGGIDRWQRLEESKRDSLGNYLKEVPGIYIRSEEQTENGGRINMFDLPIRTSDGYIDANYAELKIRAKYDGVERDTMYLFYLGPSEFLSSEATSYPTQYAFNASINTAKNGFFSTWESGDRAKLYVEGGSGYKPVVRASEIKTIVQDLLDRHADEVDISRFVINKATINLPYDVGTMYDRLDLYPPILSPTVKLRSDNGEYVSYAGLTDSSIESENQGNINYSLCKYCPDISHHVQEIAKLTQGKGEGVNADETPEQFAERLAKYDIWFLIMHEETTVSNSTSSSYDDYYNNLLYNSYYNNMMYDPYGYGYGYGGYGYGSYGYGYDSYGYNNYYNYLMMAQYASASSSTTTSSSVELDRDRFYNAVLSGPGAAGARPTLKITFSAPKREE